MRYEIQGTLTYGPKYLPGSSEGGPIPSCWPPFPDEELLPSQHTAGATGEALPTSLQSFTVPSWPAQMGQGKKGPEQACLMVPGASKEAHA